jgi:predicted dehydrogenase
MTDLTQAWPTPRVPLPIVIVGAGAIVRTAHLPVYRRLAYPVAGVFDIRPDAARAVADAFTVGRVFDSLGEACAVPGAVFDLAVPGNQILGILERLPEGAAVLIQKPMGEDLPAAKAIRACCHARGLTAAVNFQLRFSPGVLAVRELLTRGALGTIVDIEVRLVTSQPWHQWDFLRAAPRLEILYHSIHYLDTIRWLAGEPDGVYCRVVAHPELPEFRDTRSTIILDYGDRIRCSLTLNHTHRAGLRHRASHLKVEGTLGAALLTLGVNLDYPVGPPDTLQVSLGNGNWQDVPLRGSWFIEAFEGPMSNLQRFVSGDDTVLVGSVDDAIRTMALVEACYRSSAGGRTPIPEWA